MSAGYRRPWPTSVVDSHVTEFPETTRTSAEAAKAIGCTVAQIVKSLIFRTNPGDQPILVLASGENRVDERKLAKLVGAKDLATGCRLRAPSDRVCHRRCAADRSYAELILTYIDADLLTLQEIWAAAGSPNAVFKTTPEQLATMTQGKVAEIKKA